MAFRAVVVVVLGAFGGYILLFCVMWPGFRDRSVGAAMLIGVPAGHHRNGGSAARARSLALHGMPQPPGRMIVVARNREDTSWLHLQFGDIPVAVYQAVANLTEHLQRCPHDRRRNWAATCSTYAYHNSGNEAGAYLQYIVDFWDALPDSMLFLHAHEQSWHRDTPLLHKLRWGAVEFANVRHWGFTNWRCDPVAKPCHMLGTYVTPHNSSAAAHPDLNPQQGWQIAEWFSSIVAQYWDDLFQAELGPLPPGVNEPACCSEFLVTAERVRLRPLEFYKNALRFAQSPQGAGRSSEIGVAFEMLWHAVFGEPFVVHATSKCDMYYCSEEEKADPSLLAPPTTKPYRMPQVVLAELQQQSAQATG